MKLVKGDKPGWEALFSDDDLHRFTLQRPIDRHHGQGDEDGPKCRDCADARVDGTCDHDGWPCWGPERAFVSCGLNPSKADAFRNDHTVTKEIEFSWLHKCGLYIKVNAYAWRDTHPRNLWEAERRGLDITGMGSGTPVIGSNDQAIEMALTTAKRTGGIALAAWGNHVPERRAHQLMDIARRVGVDWMCFGTNANGSPKHTLTIPYSSKLVRWAL